MRLETLKSGSELEVKDSDIFIDYNSEPVGEPRRNTASRRFPF